MRAGQIRNQREQFRTNLAERSRQFDLSYRLNVQQQELNEKKFEEQLEGYELDQKIQRQTLKKNRALMKQADETLERRDAFEPKEQEWYAKAQDWNGYSPFPTIPLNAPADVRAEMLEFSNTRREQFNQNKVKQDYREGGIWMTQYHPDKVQMFDDRPPEYNYQDYLVLRRIQEHQATKAVAEGKRLDAKTQHEYDVELRQIDFDNAQALKKLVTPTEAAKAETRRQEVLKWAIPKATQTDDDSGEEILNGELLRSILAKFEEYIITGKPPEDPSLSSRAGIGPDFVNQFDAQ